MLGYFGIYAQTGSCWFSNTDAQGKKRRFLFGRLPHEIAALNATHADRKPFRRVRSHPEANLRAA